MTNIGIIGLGALGLPVAAAMASRGLTVYGVDPRVTGPPEDCSHERDLERTLALAGDRLRFVSLREAVAHCQILFVAVQTPHQPRFEGSTPLPADRADFDYTFLIDALTQVHQQADAQQRKITAVVISTVLPGTMRQRVLPWWRHTLVYNPFFIAMGTVIPDFLHPEFVLLGGEDLRAASALYQWLYGLDRPHLVTTSIENAELIKVAYNTMIGLKIGFANTLMEVCHKTGCDVDEVTGALKLAHRRLISPAYLTGGMGDGGACHPRDGIALSWLARKLDLSFDLFGATMECRERQADWLCDLMLEEMQDAPTGLLAVLGTEFKPETDIETGSAAILCRHLLEQRGLVVQTFRRGEIPEESAVFLVGCKHPEYADLVFPAGSVVIDPHRYIPDQEAVKVVRVGQAASGRRGLHSPAGDSSAVRRAAA